MQSIETWKVFIRQFAPEKEGGYNLRCYSQAERYKNTQVELIVAIKEHLDERAAQGKGNLEELAKINHDAVVKFTEALRISERSLPSKK